MITFTDFISSPLVRSRRMPGVLIALLFLSASHLLAANAAAQGPAGNDNVESDIQALLQAEADLACLNAGYGNRDRAEIPYRVERRLRSILQRDPNSPYQLQIEHDLDSVGEILAERHLMIAKMYLQGGHGRKGAQSRLLKIAEAYPRYSKTDEVLWLLAEVSLQYERGDEASAYLSRLISDYPSSCYLGLAFEKLNKIAIGTGGSAERSEPQ